VFHKTKWDVAWLNQGNNTPQRHGWKHCLIQAEFKAISLAAIILHLEKVEYFGDKKTFEKMAGTHRKLHESLLCMMITASIDWMALMAIATPPSDCENTQLHLGNE
jgi:hypothetical protein